MATSTESMYVLSSNLSKTLLNSDEGPQLDFRVLTYPDELDEILTRYLEGYGIREHLCSPGAPLDLTEVPISLHLPERMQTGETSYEEIRKGLEEAEEIKLVTVLDPHSRPGKRPASPSEIAATAKRIARNISREISCSQGNAGLNLWRPYEAPCSGEAAAMVDVVPRDTQFLLIQEDIPQAISERNDNEEDECQILVHSVDDIDGPCAGEHLEQKCNDASDYDGDTERSRSPSPLTLLTRKRLAYKNPIENFDSKNPDHLIRAATHYAHYLYGPPPDIQQTAEELTDAVYAGRFDESTCRQHDDHTISIEGLERIDSDDDSLIDELVALQGYDTASPYDSDNPHCFSPFPAIEENHHRGEYGLPSEISEDEGSTISVESDVAVYNTASRIILRDRDLRSAAEDEKWTCVTCKRRNHPLQNRCAVCLELRPPVELETSDEHMLVSSQQPSSQQNLPDSQDSGVVHDEREMSTTSHQSGSTASSEECLVCSNSPRSGCIIHGSTAHNVTCIGCARWFWRKQKPCPICRQRIDCVVELFNQ